MNFWRVPSIAPEMIVMPPIERTPVKFLVSALLAALLLTGCEADLPADQLKLLHSMTTRGGKGETKRIPSSIFNTNDTIYFFTVVSWENLDKGAGTHVVTWTWSVNGTPSGRFRQKFSLRIAPYELYSYMPASALGVGHHRVEIHIDDRAVDARDFEVVQDI